VNGRRILTSLLVIATILAAGAAHGPRRAAAAAGAGPRGPGVPAVATVGSHSIARADLDREAAAALANFARVTGSREMLGTARDPIRRQTLESLIRSSILEQEARRLGLSGSAQEAEDSIARQPFFNPGGRFDPQRLQAIKTGQPASWQASVRAVQDQIGARRLSTELERRFLPSDQAAIGAAERMLSQATVDYLALRLDEFSGSHPEPRETQVLAHYRSHLKDYWRTARAVITVVFVNEPALTDSARSLPGGAAAWSRQMRTLAEGVIARARAGATIDVAAGTLGARPNIVVASDNFPGYWHGTPEQTAMVFDLANRGRVLPQPIEGSDGWLVVRVDDITPAHLAPLSEVAKEVRTFLRQDIRKNHDEYDERGLYSRVRDSLAAPGWKIRVATASPSTMPVPEPDAAELDRWYRAHQADYASFDPRTGAIVTRPLPEIRDEVRARYLREGREQSARQDVNALLDAWQHGRREPAIETRLGARELPAAIPGTVIDTGWVAKTLSDTLWNIPTPEPAGLIETDRGWIVWQIAGHVDRVVPTFEQSRPLLAERLKSVREAQDVAGARAMFRADSMRFNLGDVIHFSRFAVEAPGMLSVPLTRAEVQKWHDDHLDRYTAPELVTARHILIEPANASEAADRAALAKARDLLRRLREGEDFERLARENSDDPATRDKGGELGQFGRGSMLEAFEKVAFALKSGEIAPEPVRTEVGYHVLQVTEHLPRVIHPLAMIYSTVGTDAAFAKADRMAAARADSIMRMSHTLADVKRASVQLGYRTLTYEFKFADSIYAITSRPFFQQMRRTRPGQILRPPFFMKGLGFWIAWVDSITPPRAPTWEDGRTAAVAEYRRGAGRRAALAKLAEIDSLLAGGWSFDSLATLWGGSVMARDVAAGRGIGKLENAAGFDSVAFGTTTTAPLAVGQVSGWIESRDGWTRVRMIERKAPARAAVFDRAGRIRTAELERRFRGYFDELKQRYPVRIVDPVLRDAPLPELPPAIGL
jgi:parvulin-like peptidyl-prolyl isomerase